MHLAFPPIERAGTLPLPLGLTLAGSPRPLRRARPNYPPHKPRTGFRAFCSPAGSFCALFLLQQLFQVLPGKGSLAISYFLRSAAADDRSAAVTAFGAQVDDIIRCLNDIQVVLDHDNGIACVHKLLQYLNELFHIIGVQAGGCLIQDIPRLAGEPASKLGYLFYTK